jgi:hypothetical protein
MKRLISVVSVLLLGAAVGAWAQRGSMGISSPSNNSGVPASVTSTGGHGGGVPASVLTTPRPGLGIAPNAGFHHHRHFRNNNNVVFVPVYSYPVYSDVGDYLLTNEDAYIPSYARPQPWDQTANQQPVAPQAPGPTVMEPGYQPAPPPQQTASVAPAAQPQPASQQPAEPQPETVLVFKDGHIMQVGNYVIVGDTLYNLSGAYREYKIPLADLDLDATVKANEDRGLEFHLPPKNPA